MTDQIKRKKEIALAAIKEVFSDMSGNIENNLDALQELRDEIDIIMQWLENDLEDVGDYNWEGKMLAMMIEVESFIALNVETGSGYLSPEALRVKDYLLAAGYIEVINLFGTTCYVLSGYDRILWASRECDDEGLSFSQFVAECKRYGVVVYNTVNSNASWWIQI